MSNPTFTGGQVRGQVPSVEPETWWNRLWRPFWTLPVTICLAAFSLGLILPLIDRNLAEYLPFVFPGGPDGARTLLSTIATAMISVTSLVFSITIVVLQLASSQFTPRVLSSFLTSRITQITLGVFLATFIYSLTVMRSVRGGFQQNDPFVPQVSVTMAFVLVVTSVGLFLAFIRHITTSIQVGNVISGIGDRSVSLVDTLYSETDESSSAGSHTWSAPAGIQSSEIVSDNRHGSVTYLDFAKLVSCAHDDELVIDVAVQIGDFVVEGQTLARAWGATELAEGQRKRIARAMGLGPERLLNQEVAFGIRQLVDIAERALSPSLNDPTTASQVIDELHRILRPLVQRASPSPCLIDDHEQVRLVYRPQTVESLLRLAVEEIAYFSADSPPVQHRLRKMLDDLSRVASPRYEPAIDGLRREVAANPGQRE